jgi:adenylate kinase
MICLEICGTLAGRLIVSSLYLTPAIASLCESFEKPKIFIAISTIMTWAKTEVEEGDASIPEDEYRRRKPHPNFKEYCALEKKIVKFNKKEKFKGYVIAPGLIYHSGDSIFNFLLKAAWHNEPHLTCYGDGANIIPTIHLEDLIQITIDVIEGTPDQKYILAVDDSKSKILEITKAIADHLSNGVVKKASKEDAFLEKSISQLEYDMLTVNLRLEPGWIKEAGIELKYESGFIESVHQIIQDYRDARGLTPLNVFVQGPPASGKTFFAQKIASFYNIHYIEVEKLVQDTISGLERKINGIGPEEIDIESCRATLNDLKDNIKNNGGKLHPTQLIQLIKEKLKSMPCKNQGYVLDGYPTSLEEATELFKGGLKFINHSL